MIKHDLTKMDIKIYHPHIITKITQGFKEDIKLLMTFNTPTALYERIFHKQKNIIYLSNNLQKRYQSGIGSLIYPIKLSRPELSNKSHTPSKCMDKTNMSHYKALLPSTK